jgi:hypothetical protein
MYPSELLTEQDRDFIKEFVSRHDIQFAVTV